MTRFNFDFISLPFRKSYMFKSQYRSSPKTRFVSSIKILDRVPSPILIRSEDGRIENASPLKSSTSDELCCIRIGIVSPLNSHGRATSTFRKKFEEKSTRLSEQRSRKRRIGNAGIYIYIYPSMDCCFSDR